MRRQRRILANAWSREPGPGRQAGPTDEEREILASLQPGHHAPLIRDTDPIPLMPLAQLFAHDVPDLDFPDGYDILQVLWCPFDAHGEREARPDFHLHWRKRGEISGSLTDAPELEVVGTGDYVPESCVLHPEVVAEHEYIGLLPEELQARIEAWEESNTDGAFDYRSDLSISPGWKVGGFATWHSTDPYSVECSCGETMRLLLTVASTEWDGGNESWVPAEDLGFIDDLDANAPTQLSVARDGSLQIFVCPTDPIGHPPHVDEQ
ncbi:MAG: hypothetical protein ACRDP3_17795 [Streptomyces sp.]|uniref:hypothetical protein n=1 Tax=Streptomyces sp. TaxID=1931 RepID=UPI003D6AF909